MQKKILRISWVFGLVLFLFMIERIGPATILARIREISWRQFAILVILRAGFWELRTLGWGLVYRCYTGRWDHGKLFGARMAGHATGFLTPASHIGGEAVRAMSAGFHDRKRNLASVVVDKTIELTVTVICVLAGVIILFFRTPLDKIYKIAFLTVLAASALLVRQMIRKQKQGFFLWVFSLLKRLRLKFRIVEKNQAKIMETDRHISDFYSRHQKIILPTGGIYLISILFWSWEIYLTLRYMGIANISPLEGYLIVTLGSVAFILPLTPGSLGTYEAAYLAVFSILGLSSSSGITLTLIRRSIALLWAGAGLIFLIGKREKTRLKQDAH